jgi:hypothetical protein
MRIICTQIGLTDPMRICLGLAAIKCKLVITGYCENEHLVNGLGLVASRIWHKLLKISPIILIP